MGDFGSTATQRVRQDYLLWVLEELTAQLAAETFLFTPADIKVVVQTAARQAIRQATNTERPFLNTRHLLQTIQQQPRSIQPDIAEAWIEEAAHDLGQADRQITWLREEIQRAFGGRN